MVTVAAYTSLTPLHSFDFGPGLEFPYQFLPVDFPFGDPYLGYDYKRSDKTKMESIISSQFHTNHSSSVEPPSQTFDLEDSAFDDIDLPDLVKITSNFDPTEVPYSPFIAQSNPVKETDKYSEMSQSESSIEESPESPTLEEPDTKTIEVKNRSQSQRRRKPKLSEDDDLEPSYKPVTPRRSRRGGKRQVRLWEFIKGLLENKDATCHIRWVNKAEGTFRLLNSGAVARMWGKTKNRPDMTYEKMSRAMRYYYAKGILHPIPQKLTYKFGDQVEF